MSSFDRFEVVAFVQTLIRVQAPAHSIARYTIQTLDMTATKPSPYFGEPRPELDEAWSKLTECTIFSGPDLYKHS